MGYELSMLVWRVWMDNQIRAACLHVEEAAMLVSCLGNGSTITYHHEATRHDVVVWKEGLEDQPASESYDNVATVAHSRAGRYHLVVT